MSSCRAALKQCFEGGIAQLDFLLGIQNQDGQRAVLNQRIEIRSPLDDPVFQLIVRLL